MMQALPPDFTVRMQQQLGADYDAFEAALQTPAPVSLRINPLKLKSPLNATAVQWCPTGYYLNERPLFAADPWWHAGVYYVQEAGSMTLEQAFRKAQSLINAPLTVLDLCAAPGGKSTHLASMLTDEDVLVSNEVIKSRVGVLTENMARWGYANSLITNADSEDFKNCGPVFDIIVTDVPCSGEGLFRKDPNAVNEWSTANTELCALRQKRIIDNIELCLKPGGFLIYSTCTYNPGENETIAESLINKGWQPIPFSIGSEEKYCHQLMPHTHLSEGFFIALLQKPMSDDTLSNKTKPVLKKIKDQRKADAYFTNKLDLYEIKKHTVALSENTAAVYETLAPHINIYSAGIAVTETADTLQTPSPLLPFYTAFNTDAFSTLELNDAQALQYLRREALPWSDAGKGYTLLQYKGQNIGFGKMAGNRINNLFPSEWRLRKALPLSDFFSLESLAK